MASDESRKSIEDKSGKQNPPAASLLGQFQGVAGQVPVTPGQRAAQVSHDGDTLFRHGKPQAALQRYQQAVELDPSNAAYHTKLAITADHCGMTTLVEKHFLEALRLNPNLASAHSALGHWYNRFGKQELALKHTETAIKLEPRNPEHLVAYGTVLLNAGETKEAWKVVKPLIAGGYRDRWLAMLYAELAPKLEQEKEAIEFIERTIKEVKTRAARDGTPMLHFAASNLLEQTGRYDEAFEHARLANEAVRSISNTFDPKGHSERISLKIRSMTPARLSKFPRATHQNLRPVFIVGMPRSGTSLIEQILASHPDVYGAGELSIINQIFASMQQADWAEGSIYPDCLDILTSRNVDQMAEQYLKVINAMNTTARFVTDKMPYNYLHLELIELMFPGSRIIHCTRNPLDTCLSCYVTNFTQGTDYKVDLGYLGSYYRDYARLMNHWNNVIQMPMLEVRYEDLVLSPNTEVPRMLEFLGLPCDERCMQFHKNKRVVHTASRYQVRKPIYRASIGRWKNYEKHLGELIRALGG